MTNGNDHSYGATTCPVCRDTGRAKTETIDAVSMVAWCRCPAGARALDLELVRRRGGGRATPGEPPPPALREPPIAPDVMFAREAPAVREPPVIGHPPVVRDPPALRRSAVVALTAPAPAPRGAAVPVLRDGATPVLRPVHDHRPAIHVVPRDGRLQPAALPIARSVRLPDAQLIAAGCRADERAGVIHYVTIRICGKAVEVPCDRATADAYATAIDTGASPRFRVDLDPISE